MIDEWIGTAAAPAAAVVLGGSEQAFFEALLTGPRRKLRVLCDREYAQKVAMIANDLFRNPPAIQFVSRLDRDLEAVMVEPEASPLVVPFNTLGHHIISHTTRMNRQADMLGGYRVPERVIVSPLIRDLRELIGRVATSGRAPVILHDANGGYLHRIAEPVLTVYGYAEDAFPDLDRIDVLRRTPEEPALDDDRLQEVLAHARYLCRSDPQDLRTLHQLATTRAVRSNIISFWRGNLEKAAGTLPPGEMLEDVEYALKKLDASV